MKLMLASLAITSLGLSSVVALPKNEVSTEKQNVFAGTEKAGVEIEQSISDWALGNAKEKEAEASHTFKWSNIQIDKSIVSKMDFTRSWLKLNINYSYSDNAGSGNSDNFNSIENLLITNSDFATGINSYENGRHHSGGNRLTDHQWKWQVTVNDEGISLWDWVYVWANGNLGNTATSKAAINIVSFEYHFEFLV